MAALRSRGAGKAGLVVASGAAAGARLPEDFGGLAAEVGPGRVAHAMDLVTAPADLAAAVAALLGDVVVVENLTDGVRVLRADPRLRVVTRDGDVLGAHWGRGGSAGEQSLLSLRAAASQASSQLTGAKSGASGPSVSSRRRWRMRSRPARYWPRRGRDATGRRGRRGDLGQAGFAGRPRQGGAG